MRSVSNAGFPIQVRQHGEQAGRPAREGGAIGAEAAKRSWDPSADIDGGRAVGELLARAFRDNPMNRAVLRRDPEARVRANRIGARLLLDLAWKTGHVLTADPIGIEGDSNAPRESHPPVPAGALVGFPPGRIAAPPPSLRQIGLLLRQGIGATLRWGAVQAALVPIRPSEPHWTLAMVGVEPARQGRGIGGALVARWIAGLAGSPAPAWVETDRPELVAFYGRFGFELAARCEVYGVEVLGLRRPPDREAPRSGG